jgi:hypothetical protein
MDLLSDENIERIVNDSNPGATISHYEIELTLLDSLIVELNFLVNEDVIKTWDRSDLIKINYYIEKVDKYKSGRCDSLKEIIKNVQLSVL